MTILRKFLFLVIVLVAIFDRRCSCRI